MKDWRRGLANRQVSLKDILQAMLVILVIIGPVFQTSVFPESSISKFLFGTPARILSYYVISVGSILAFNWIAIAQAVRDRRGSKH